MDGVIHGFSLHIEPPSYFEIYSGQSMIVIVFWAVENNLVYLRPIMVGHVILIVSWAVENK